MCESIHVAVNVYINYSLLTFVFAVLLPQALVSYAVWYYFSYMN